MRAAARALLAAALWLAAPTLGLGRAAAQGVDPFGGGATFDEPGKGAEASEPGAGEASEVEAEPSQLSQVEAQDPSSSAEAEVQGESGSLSELARTSDVSGGSGRSDDEDFELHVYAGAGVGSRSFERPLGLGVQRLDEAAFAAADVGLDAEGMLSERIALGARFSFHTSIGLTVEEPAVFGLPNTVTVRAQRIAGAVVPSMRLGGSAASPSLAVPVGFGARTFWHQLHGVQTPSYTLAGPEVRIELVAPLGDLVTLRVGPEVQWLLVVGKALRREGVASQGLALGGEVVVALHLLDEFNIELSYRESHASASGVRGAADFEDIERFGTARVGGSF